MSGPRRTSRGFTLIELVLVMLIIGLLLALVAPTMGGFMRSQRLDQSARTVAAMLKQARVSAAADARPHRLVIDTDDNTCWLEELTPEGFDRPESSDGRVIELGDDLLVELEGGETEGSLLTVRVEPDGTGELAQITLTRTRDQKRVAIYCQTPTEPYIVGKPVSPQQLEDGGDDVDVDD